MIRALGILNLRRVARVRLRVVLAVVAVAAGSSLGLSVFVVTSSVSYSLTRFSQQVGGAAALRVVGSVTSGSLDQSVLDRIERTPGVAQAVPLVQAVTAVRTARGGNRTVVALGVDCRAAVLVGQGGCPVGAPSASAYQLPPDLLVVSPSIGHQLDGSSWLQTDTVAVPMAHAISVSSLGAINNGNVVVLPLSVAQRLFERPGRFDNVYVTPVHGVALTTLRTRLQRTVGAQNGVVDATAAPPAIAIATAAFTPLLVLLAVLASGIAAVLVYNVINLTVEERRREQAIAAAVGAPPSLLVAGPLVEAGVLGAVGGVLGALGGAVLARPIVSSISKFTTDFAGVPINVHTTTATYLIGLVLGAAIGIGAAIRPVLRTTRLDVAAELSGRNRRQQASAHTTITYALIYTGLTLGGLVLSFLGERHGALAPWQPAASTIGFLVTALFSVVAVGAWAPVVIRLVFKGSGPKRGVASLGIANLVREPGLTAVMAIAVAATVGVAFDTASYQLAINGDIASAIHRSSRAHGLEVSTVASLDGNNLDALVPASTLQVLGHLRGVSRVESFNVFLVGHQSGHLTLVEATDNLSYRPALFEGTASLAKFKFGAALVGAGLARRERLHAGSILHLDTPAGTVAVSVQGIWDDGNFAGNNVTLPLSLATRLYPLTTANQAELIPAAGYDASQLARIAHGAHVAPFVVYSTPDKQLARQTKSVSGQIAPFWALQRALLLVSFVTVLSTLLLVGFQRRREFGLLGAVGLTPGQLFGMVASEAATVGAVGALLGLAMGLAQLAALLQVTPLFIGFHDSLVLDLGSVALYAPLAVVVAVAASLWPAWRASKLELITALQYE